MNSSLLVFAHVIMYIFVVTKNVEFSNYRIYWVVSEVDFVVYHGGNKSH